MEIDLSVPPITNQPLTNSDSAADLSPHTSQASTAFPEISEPVSSAQSESDSPSTSVSSSTSAPTTALVSAPATTPASVTNSSETEALGRGHRPKKPLTKLADYILKITNSLGLNQNDCKYPISDYMTDTRFSKKHQEYGFTITNSHEPQHYSQAVLDEHWCNVMRF